MEKTVLERLARAWFDAEKRVCSQNGDAWESAITQYERDVYMRRARSALSAIREPGKAALDAGMSVASDCLDSDYSSDVVGGRHEYSVLRSDAPSMIWKAMIDTALA